MITWHVAEVTSERVVESFLRGVRRSCFIPVSSSVQGNHWAWLTFILPPEWSCASDRLSQFASSCGTHPIRPGHCASCILALHAKLFSSLSRLPSFHFFHPHLHSPSPPKKCTDMRGWFRKPGSRIVRIVLAWRQTYYIDLSFLCTWMAPDNADFEQNILSK